MKSVIIMLALCLCSYAGLEAQGSNKAKEEMNKLKFLEGNWKGSGWIFLENQEKVNFAQQEEVRFAAGGTSLYVLGTGFQGEKLYHEALGVFSFNEEKGHYDFDTWVNDGRKGKAKAKWVGEELHWYPAEKLRYVIRLNEKNQWIEKGEYEMNPGKWFQFFEMTLDQE